MADKKLPVLDGRAAGGVSMVSALVRREFAMLLPSLTLATAMSRNNIASMGHGQLKYKSVQSDTSLTGRERPCVTA